MAEPQERQPIRGLTIINYSAMYMPVSMVLLPLAVYVLPYYVELGISLYTMSAIILAARFSAYLQTAYFGMEPSSSGR